MATDNERKIMQKLDQDFKRRRQEQEHLEHIAALAEPPPPPADAPASTRPSSIASSRRGRPTGAKDSDVTVETTPAAEPAATDADTIAIVGDFGPAIADDEIQRLAPKHYLTDMDYWQQRQAALGRLSLTPGECDAYQLSVQSSGADNWAEPILLNSGRIPDGYKVPRSPMNVYLCSVDNIDRGWCALYKAVLAPGVSSIDLAKAPALPESEVHEIFANYRPPEKVEPPPPPPPTYKRTPRIAGDACSYLGLTVGKAEEDVTISNRWAWHCFNLPQALMVGAISAAVRTDFDASKLRVRIFDAGGSRVLKTDLQRTGNGVMSAKFDHVRLVPGDHLLAWDTNSHLHGLGSCKNCRCGVFTGGVPDAPRLDELLKLPREIDAMTHEPTPCGMPQFHFEAD
jgi:hypothetical protein